MKSHAMKARAKAEAQTQLQQHKQQLINDNQQRFATNNANKSLAIDLTSEQQQLQQILNESTSLDNLSPLNLCQSSAVAAALGLNPQSAGNLPTAAKMNLINALNAAAASRHHQQQQAVNNNTNNNLATAAAVAKQAQQQFFANLQQTSLQQQLDITTHSNLLQQLHSNFN